MRYTSHLFLILCASLFPQCNLVILLSLEKTMKNLEVVLNGYENVEVVPSLFVFMGNFCSQPCNLAFHSFSMLR